MAASGGTGNIAKVEAGLKSAREQLSTLVEDRFSKAGNKKIWQDQAKHIPKEPEASDSNAIQAAKNALLFLKEMEDMVHGMNSFSQQSRAGKVVTGARKTAATGWAVAKEWWAGNKSWWEMGSELTLGKHFNALIKLAQDAGIPTKGLESLKGSATDMSNITTTISGFLNDYLEIQRPAKAEQPYQSVEYGPARDWHPSAQESHEWFQTMLEPMRKGMMGALSITGLLDKFLKDAESKGQKFDAAQTEMIAKTKKALEKAFLGSDGYYDIKGEDIETPLSRSLKGLFNMMWGINQLGNGFWDEKWHSKTGTMEKISANVGAGIHGKKVLDNYFQVQFPVLGSELGALKDQMYNAMLYYSNQMIKPKLTQISDKLHAAELQNDLRFGALSQDFRQYLDPIVWLCVDQGIPAENPFGYTQAKDAFLKDKEENKRDDSPEATKYREAGNEIITLRREAAIQALKDRGLNVLLRATAMATNFENVNLPQKRTLAVIKGDLDGASRNIVLDRAHAIATDFVEREGEIKHFIGAVNKEDKALGHALTVETMLGGFLPADFKNISLPTSDQKQVFQDLTQVLDRLEADQILRIFELKDDESKKRAALFLTLLNETPINEANLGDALSQLENIKADPGFLVNQLVEKYWALDLSLAHKKRDLNEDISAWELHQPERLLMNKIGLFLGRLALVDQSSADYIFNNEEAGIAPTILLNETVNTPTVNGLRSDRAIYYEVFAQSLIFNYVGGKPSEEKRTFDEFLAANKNAVLAIHGMVKPNEILNDEEIYGIYENNPIALVDLIDTFIKTKLSLGSEAENKMREFFSAVLLTRGEQSAGLRDEILTNQLSEKGSINAEYVNRLTETASYAYWELLRSDLIEKAKSRKFPKELSSMISSVPDKTEKGILEREANEFFKNNNVKFNKLGSELITKTTELSRHVKESQQDMNILDKDLVDYNKLIQDKVKLLEKIDEKQKEAVVLLNNAKNSLSNKQIDLPAGLENNLKDYLTSQRKLILEATVDKFATVSINVNKGVGKKFEEWTRIAENPQEFKDTRGLEKTVDEIVNQLHGYVKKRTGPVSDMHKLFGSGLRDEKNKLAREYEKIFAGFAAILKEPNLTEEKYKYCIEQVNGYAKKLVKDHEALIVSHGKKDPANDEFMKRINKIQKMTFDLKSEIDVRIEKKKLG